MVSLDIDQHVGDLNTINGDVVVKSMWLSHHAVIGLMI